MDHEEFTLEELLAKVYHALTTGSNMNSGNYAFQLLCDKLGVDTDELTFEYLDRKEEKEL